MVPESGSNEEGSLESLKVLLLRLGFEWHDRCLKFKNDKNKSGSLLGNHSKRGVHDPVVSVHGWTIFNDGRIDGAMNLDLSRLENNLRESVSSFFGTKSECHLSYTGGSKLHVSVLCIQPSTKTQERGYASLPMADDLPLGTFGFLLDFLPSNFGIIISFIDLYCLGYTHPDFILKLPKWIRTSLGVQGIYDESASTVNINEIFVPYGALLCSRIEAKATDRRRAVELIHSWKERCSQKQDVIMEVDSEKKIISLKSSSLGEIDHISQISMSLLKIREQVRHHQSFEMDFSEGRWTAVSDYLGKMTAAENNYFLQLRASYFAMMTRTPNRHPYLLTLTSRSASDVENLSARIRLSSSREAKLSFLSQIINNFSAIWPESETDPYIGQVFSEFLGDLWRPENSSLAKKAYERALEYSGHPGRILRKKKDLFLEMGDVDNTLQILDDLIEVEPRKMETSRLLTEKAEILLRNSRAEEACSTGLKAVSLDRHSICAIQVLANALVKSEKYAEAIRALDDFIEDRHPSFSARQQAELHAKVGEIWHRYLKSSEIAVDRLTLASRLDPERAEYLYELAIIQENLGRLEDHARTLELYSSMMTKQDEPEKVRWANEKLSQIYSSDSHSLANQKTQHLTKILKTIPMSLEAIQSLERSFSLADDWKIIIQAVISRLFDAETELEKGKLLDFSADQAEAILGDLPLAGHCRELALSHSFLSSNIFHHNYDLFRSSDNQEMLGMLCVTWVERAFSDRVEIVRECIESEYHIDSDLLDQWAIRAADLSSTNYDLILHRLYTHIRFKNLARTISIWKAVNDIDIGPIRRKKIFDSVVDFLAEGQQWADIKDAFDWFGRNGEDALQISLDAIETLKNKIPDRDLLDFVVIVLNHGDVPKLDHNRIIETVRNYPEFLRLYFTVLAENTIDLQEKSEYMVKALGIEVSRPSSTREMAVVNELFSAPVTSQWYGAQRVSRLLTNKEFEKQIYYYLKYWVPLVSAQEKQNAFLLLLDLMTHSFEDVRLSFASLEDMITGFESESIIHKISNLAAGLDENTVKIFFSKAILDPSPKYTLFLKAIYSRNPELLIKLARDYLGDGQFYEGQNPDYGGFFRTIDSLASTALWQELESTIGDLFGEDARCYDPEIRRIRFFLVRQHESLKISFQKFLKTPKSSLLPETDCIFRYLLEALEDGPKADDLVPMIKNAALECAPFTVNISLLSRLESLTCEDSNETLMIICAAYYRLEDRESCKALADQIYSRFQSGGSGHELSQDNLRLLDSFRETPKSASLLLKDDLHGVRTHLADSPNPLPHGAIPEAPMTSPEIPLEMPLEIPLEAPLKESVSEVLGTIQENLSVEAQIFGSPVEANPDDKATELLRAAPDSVTGIQDDPQATSVENRQLISESNWQEMARSNLLRPDDLSDLLNLEFSNPLAHHVSVQVVAILTGQIAQLKDWHMPVWRKRNSSNYLISIEERYPESQLSPSLVGPMAKIFMEMNLFLSLVYRERLLVHHIASHSGISLDKFSQNLVPLTWDSPIMVRSGISAVRERFEKRQITFASLANLGKNIFFDVKSRQIIFDESYYHKMPPSHLFHGLLIKFWEIKTKFQVYFLIDPIKELWPLMKLLIDFLSEKKMSRDTLSATIHNKREIGEFLEKIDFHKLAYHLTELGTFRQSDFLKTYFAMQSHLYRIVVSETLDIIGLLECITGFDLTAGQLISLHDLFKSSPYFQPLFKFVLQLQPGTQHSVAMDVAQ